MAPNSTENLGLAEAVLQITPLQFHFHTTSEHTVDGKFSALELHLVTNVTGANTSCADNCTAVFGVLFDFSPDGLVGKACLLCMLHAGHSHCWLRGLVSAHATSLPDNTLFADCQRKLQ